MKDKLIELQEKKLIGQDRINFINDFNILYKKSINDPEVIKLFEADFFEYSKPLDSTIKEEYSTYLSSGDNGSIYINNDKTKIYKETFRDDFDMQKMEYFASLNLPNIVFPRELIYHLNATSRIVLRGYITEYINNSSIHTLSEGLTIEEYKQAILKAEADLKRLTKADIQASDLHANNFLFCIDDKTFKFIDTDSFNIQKNKDFKKVQMYFGNRLFFVHNKDLEGCLKSCNIEGKNFKDYYKVFLSNQMKLSEFIEYYLEYLEKINETKINTFEDYLENTSRTRK
ncbi:MAG: hypothetical protein R3Y13_04550 [bacterium]